MDGSEIDSQGRESKIEAESSPIPTVITDHYFEELQSKCLSVLTSFCLFRSLRFIKLRCIEFQTIKSLQAAQNVAVADDVHTLLGVCQLLRANLETEAENVKKVQSEIDAKNIQYSDSVEEIRKHEQTISQQCSEIGK